MLGQLTRYWWVPTLRGVLAILFGVLAFVFPKDTVTALTILFGAYALVDGISALYLATQVSQARGWLLLEGIAGIAFGVLTFLYPNMTAVTLLYFVAGWAIATGVFEIAAAIAYRREIANEWRLALAGLLSIILGVLLIVRPDAGLQAMVWLLGSYAIVVGVLLTALGFRLKALQPGLQAAGA